MFMRRGRATLSTRRALIIIPVWLVSSIWLWSWWFNPSHITNMWLFVLLSAALVYENILAPLVFFFFVTKAAYPPNRRPVKGSKVALITLCVPSQESMSIIERQLKAMKAVEYPHDSWILDEGNNSDIRKLARQHGVKYFSRKGIKKYNLTTQPYVAKTKAGNVNAWLHFAKRYKYEFFVQFDIDHLPQPNYLDKTLGHFRDKKVGWVQAPSVNNNLSFWIARGSAEQEIGLQGPMQMGFYGYTKAPVITGSHATFRMKAITAVGGFQATRAEDHLNTLALMADGWNGVYVPEIIAEGNGPETLEAYLTQQFAWSRSMTIVFLRHSWQFMKKLSWKRRLQFGFMQTWYPLWSLSYLILFITPIVALMLNSAPITTTYQDFWLHTPVLIVSSFCAYWVGKPLMQPSKVSLTWRGTLLHLIRWPAILQGILSGIRGGTKPYQVTPKGKFLKRVPSIKLYRTFLLLSAVSSFAVIYSSFAYGSLAPATQFFFAFFNILIMLTVCLFDLNVRLRNINQKLRNVSRAKYGQWFAPITAVATVTVVSGLAILTPFQPNQTTLAISTIPQYENRGDINKLPPQLLTDEELYKVISNPMFKRDSALPEPTLGLHETKHPHKTAQPYIRHTFIDWREARNLEEEIVNSQRVGATSLITIEPKGELDGAKLLNDIASGVHDKRINNLLTIMDASPNTIYVRFGHEMDLPDTYPWGNQDPATYIAAYKHFVDMANSQHIDNLQWVWSPAGNSSAENYYPGDDYVDVVGTTIISVPSWYDNAQLSFDTLQNYRANLKVFNKPLWITEFGVENNDPVYQNEVITQALQEYQDDGFQALIYINIPDSNSRGRDYRLPDLTIFGDTFMPATIRQAAPVKTARVSVAPSKPKTSKPKTFDSPVSKVDALTIISKQN